MRQSFKILIQMFAFRNVLHYFCASVAALEPQSNKEKTNRTLSMTLSSKAADLRGFFI